MNKLIKMVDQLGLVNAQIAALEKQAKAIKAELVAAGLDKIEGAEFCATIVTSQRAQLDIDAVREKLSQQFLTAHTRYVDVVAVRVSRNAIQLAA